MPVYWFALGQVVDKHLPHALLIFFILHVLVYPASNGYNSYMDRDTGPIGGLERPPAPTRQLFFVTIIMDILAMLLSLFISAWFAVGLAVYILASRAYSYRGIRLKRLPVIGYLTVIICQGALVFFLVYHGSSMNRDLHIPPEAMIISSLLIGGFYPLTQVYQHDADRKDGIKTISMLLGIRGTFIFTAAVYGIAMLLMVYYFLITLQIKEFQVLATCMLPILVYFFIWAAKVWKNPAQANFTNTMRMNLLASVCTNAGFIAVLIMG
ncbi:MAG: UbiA prenyltransferase family protein [Chitinophagaceae bacterium]|nr:UbiA prenyltransferase family protein [Chitinophagaceae bacterium]